MSDSQSEENAVHDALLASLVKADMPVSRLYVQDTERGGRPAIVFCDNWDRLGSLIHYRDTNEWYYFPCYGIEETLQTFEQCMGDARCFWAG